MNGTAALAHAAATLEPALTSAPAAKLDTDCPSDLERRIGETAADCAVAISIGMADYIDHGRFADDVKAEGGRTLANVVMLALEHFGEFDFDLVVRREGRRVLERRFGIMMRERRGRAATDAAFEDLIGHVLVLKNHVVTEERARTH
jgi:hypothetical protein